VALPSQRDRRGCLPDTDARCGAPGVPEDSRDSILQAEPPRDNHTDTACLIMLEEARIVL